MSASASSSSPKPEGVFSLLDTDLYKITMQCAVLKYFPQVGEFSGVLCVFYVWSKTDSGLIGRGYLWLYEPDSRHEDVAGSIQVVIRANGP